MKLIQRTEVMALATLLGMGQLLFAADQKEQVVKPPRSTNEAPVAFLGVAIEELSPAILSHLPENVPAEQGVLVQAVGEGSPAEKAGIKVHDILLTYAGQKLFSPGQLLKLIRADKPGQEVELTLIRSGKLKTLTAALGTRPAATPAATPPTETPAPPKSHRRSDSRGKRATQAEQPEWGSFDSMTLKKLEKGRFHASIKHTDKNGKLQTHEFEGTLDEIHEKIDADQDLTPIERKHLLRGLGLQRVGIPIWIFPDEPMFDF